MIKNKISQEKKILFTLFIIIIFCFSSNDAKPQTNIMSNNIKKVTEENGIKEYTLNNSLKIILKRNNSIPLVTFSIWYKVGSRNEIDGIYGLAHFLEHMMFKGTKKLKKGQISEIIQGYGGLYNAFTFNDGTAYYETILPKYLEKVIEIESDSIKGSLIDQKELELERNVVLSELEGDLNNPVFVLDKELRHAAYEVNPYKHPTIGYKEDINNIDSKKMKEFYKKYYNPNNATIVLVGNFEENKALNLINKYFSKIKNDKSNQINIPQEKPQEKEKRLTIKKPGSYKILEIAYHIPNTKDSYIYPLNIIEDILIKSEKSPFKKQLVEKGLATDVYGGAEANIDPGLFYIIASLTPKAKHKQVEKIILNEIKKLIKTPPTGKEINSSKNRIKASYLFGLDGTYNQALNIGYFEVINTWKQSQLWPNQIDNVTRSDVTEALSKFFKKENRTIGYFIPILRKGQKYETQSINLNKTQHLKKEEEANTKYTLNKKKSYDIKPIKFNKTNIKDGSTILTYNEIDLPITIISGIIKGGASLLPKKNEWDCELVVRNILKGSKRFTKEEIEEIVDETGSQIEVACDDEAIRFNITSLNENLLKTIDLFNEAFLNPTFPEKDIKTEKENLIAELIELNDNTLEFAKRKLNQIIYPSDHPYYANDIKTDIKLVKKTRKADLIKAHKKLIKNNTFIISIVTNQTNNEIKNIIKKTENDLSYITNKQEGLINIPDTLITEEPKVDKIHFNDKPQSDIFLGHAGSLKRTDPDFYATHLANYILGGSSLSSRLSKKVRDNAGLVYTIYSYLNASYGKGEFGIYFGSNNNNIESAINLIKEELEQFTKKGISQSELEKAKISLLDSFTSRNLSSYKNIANTLAAIEFYKLGNDYINNYPKIIKSIKLEDVNKAIKKHIFPSKLNTVIAGDTLPNKN